MKTARSAVLVLGTLALLVGAGGTWADQSNDQRGSNVIPGSAVSGVQALVPAPSAGERGVPAMPTPPTPPESIWNEPAGVPPCPRCVSI
jgi:hypothetical protein